MVYLFHGPALHHHDLNQPDNLKEHLQFHKVLRHLLHGGDVFSVVCNLLFDGEMVAGFLCNRILF